MDMNSMYKLQEMCCRQIDKIVQRGELSASALEQAALLVDTVKDVYTIEAMEGGESEYSRDGSYGAYDSNASYANRGKHYVRGHYSRDGGSYSGRGYSRGRYSRDDSKDEMIRKLEQMMSNANNLSEEEAYRKAMENLQNA